MICNGTKGAFQHGDVNIGWYPMEAIEACEIRSLPGPNAGELIGKLTKGRTCGRQSVRNPDFKAKPARRPSVKRAGTAYVFVYARKKSKTGWAPLSSLRALPLGLNPKHREPLLGPNDQDFEVGHPHGKGTKGTGPGCGKTSTSKRLHRVVARELHLRYSAHGTSKHYLHNGDTMRILIAKAVPSDPFHFVEIVSLADGQKASVRPGMRGWVQAAHIKAV